MRTRILLSTTLALTLAGLSACGDDVTDPASLAESAEAEAVMRSAAALPSLVSLMSEADPADDDRARATLLRARELWDAGTVVDDARGSARRRLAINYALPVLRQTVAAEEWVAFREGLEDWVETAESMLRHLSLPPVERRIVLARSYMDRSDAAATERSRQYYDLLAASTLVETTPRYVARALAAEAERAVSAAVERSGPSGLPARDLERAERLKDWAVRAVEEGEYLLAIQRAYYAIQLVEVE